MVLSFLMTAFVAVTPPVPPGDIIAAELGLPILAGLPDTLSRQYAADAIALEEMRKSPERYPVRIAVLNAAAAVQSSYKVKPIVEIFEKRLEPEKANIVEVQKTIATTILKLHEAVAELDAAVKVRKQEPSARWQAHLDFLLAETRFRIGLLEELNLAYGTVHRNELPTVKSNDNGWRLERDEKMRSKSDIRQLVEDAQTAFEAIQKTYAGTPWGKLAERELATKPGLAWSSGDVRRPPPQFEPKRKRP